MKEIFTAFASYNAMAIGEFSRLSGIAVSALRYYDEIDLLKPSAVDSFSQYRYYSKPQLFEANFIETWKALGFTLNEIKCLMSKGTGELAESCYKKQIAIMEEEIRGRLKRKGELERNIQAVNRFSSLTEDEIDVVSRKIIRESFLLTIEDSRAEGHAILIEKRKTLEALAERHALLRANEGPFMTTRFLETCEEPGHRVLYQMPLEEGAFPEIGEIIKVPAHAALCVYHRGKLKDIAATIDMIRDHASSSNCRIGKTVSCVFWIDHSITLDETLHLTEVRIPLKKRKPQAD